jgi:hypothetical protein
MFSFRWSPDESACVVDIDDGSVSAALVRPVGEGVEIVANAHASLPPEPRGAEQALSLIATELGTVIEKIVKVPGIGSVETASVHVIARMPWSHFRTSRATEEFKELRTVTKDVIGELGKNALALAHEPMKGEPLRAGVLQVFLNGYPTTKPLNKQAQSLAVVAYESTIDTDFKNAIAHALGAHFPHRSPAFHSGTHGILSMVREHMPSVKRFLVVDIGYSESHIAVVREELITQEIGVPEGLSTILKRIAPSAIPDETLTLFKMIANDTCSTSACQSLKDSIAKTEPELVRIFGEALGTLATRRRVPNTCFIAAPAEITPWLATFFSRLDFSQFTTSLQPFEIEPISAEQLVGVLTWRGGIPDARIAAAVASVHILGSTTVS